MKENSSIFTIKLLILGILLPGLSSLAIADDGMATIALDETPVEEATALSQNGDRDRKSLSEMLKDAMDIANTDEVSFDALDEAEGKEAPVDESNIPDVVISVVEDSAVADDFNRPLSISPEKELPAEATVAPSVVKVPEQDAIAIEAPIEMVAEVTDQKHVEISDLPDISAIERRIDLLEADMLKDTNVALEERMEALELKVVGSFVKSAEKRPSVKKPVPVKKPVQRTEYQDRIMSAEMDVIGGKPDEAYKKFSKLLRENPASTKVNFSFGISCFSLKKYSQARLAFERVLQIDGDHLPARYALARTLLVSQQHEQAQEELKRILRQDPPQEIRRNVEQYLQRMGKDSDKWGITYRVEGGFLDDDNVNIGPKSELIEVDALVFGIESFSINDDTKPRESDGMFASFSVSGSRDVGEQEKWVMTADASLYQNWLSGADENESRLLSAVIGSRRLWSRSMAQIPFVFANINYGHDSLVNIIGTSPMYLYVAGAEADVYWTTMGLLQSRDYDELDDRDSTYISVGERVKKYVGAKRHIISASANLFHDYADESIYESDGYILRAGLQLKMPWELVLYARYFYSDTDYAEKHPLAPTVRSDTQNQLILGLNKKLNDHWGVDLSSQQIDNKSTFDLYEYERNVIIYSTYYRF